MDTYSSSLAAAKAEDPTITGVHGNVGRLKGDTATPWAWTVDFTTAECPLGDMGMSSLEYGNAPTFTEAVAAADSVVTKAVGR